MSPTAITTNVPGGAGVGTVVGPVVAVGNAESVAPVVGVGLTTGALQATSSRTPRKAARVAREEVRIIRIRGRTVD